jgi:two-component system NtrC family sensor kinase
LLDFARRREPQKSSTDLAALARQTLALLGPTAKKHGVKLEGPAPDSSERLDLDAGQIQQVLTNLVVNGIQAMPRGGRLTLALRRERALPPVDSGGEEGEYLRIDVRDEGAGIPPDVLPRIFDPFFTTKGVGEGTGLGLSVSFGIVREHRGWIGVETEVGRGSRFSVFLPLPQSQEVQA